MLSDVQILILPALSFIDTVLTYNWAMACVKWKPSLKLKQVESNPFIIVCWNNFGVKMGSIISGVMLFGIQYALSSIHVNIFYIIVAILVFANLNHIRNFHVLKNRLKKESTTSSSSNQRNRSSKK